MLVLVVVLISPNVIIFAFESSWFQASWWDAPTWPEMLEPLMCEFDMKWPFTLILWKLTSGFVLFLQPLTSSFLFPLYTV